MSEGRKTDRLNKITMIAERWLEIRGHDAQMWDITTTMHIYSDDCIVVVNYRFDSAMSWDPKNNTSNKG